MRSLRGDCPRGMLPSNSCVREFPRLSRNGGRAPAVLARMVKSKVLSGVLYRLMRRGTALGAGQLRAGKIVAQSFTAVAPGGSAHSGLGRLCVAQPWPGAARAALSFEDGVLRVEVAGQRWKQNCSRLRRISGSDQPIYTEAVSQNWSSCSHLRKARTKPPLSPGSRLHESYR